MSEDTVRCIRSLNALLEPGSPLQQRDPGSCCVLWDFDGTLVTRPRMWANEGVQVLKALAVEPVPTVDELDDALEGSMPWHRSDHVISDLSTPKGWWASVSAGYASAYRLLGVRVPSTRAHDLLVRQAICDPSRYELYPEALQVLHDLDRLGVIQIVVSNHIPELELVCAGLGIAPPVNAVITSALVGYEKPRPELFRAALELVDSGRFVLMVGDGIDTDYRGALAVGIDSVVVERDPKLAVASDERGARDR